MNKEIIIYSGLIIEPGGDRENHCERGVRFMDLFYENKSRGRVGA